ncbi:non-ribosomal peptide synthetase, partial [Chitinophaga oryziterrae]
MEGHGRENISSSVDVSRTIGWFTSMYPVLLKNKEDTGSLLKGIKEQLRSIPDKGLGYGLQETKTTSFDLLFNYLGQLDNSGKLLVPAEEATGADIAAGNRQSVKISVNSMVQGGELFVHWNYSKRHYEDSTIAQLSSSYISAITELINHCVSQTGAVFTPSDYGLGKEISYEELDKFMEEPYRGSKRGDHIAR